MAKRFKAKDITVQEMTKDGLHSRNLATGEKERISRSIRREFDLERHSSNFLAGGNKRTLKLQRNGSSRKTARPSETPKDAKSKGGYRDKWHSDNHSPTQRNVRIRAQTIVAPTAKTASASAPVKPYAFDAKKSTGQALTAKQYSFNGQQADASSARRRYTGEAFKRDNDFSKSVSPKSGTRKPSTSKKNNLYRSMAGYAAYRKAQQEGEDNQGVSATLSGAQFTAQGKRMAYPVIDKASNLFIKTVSGTPSFINNMARRTANKKTKDSPTSDGRSTVHKNQAARSAETRLSNLRKKSVSDTPSFINNLTRNLTDNQTIKQSKQKAAKQAAARASQEAARFSKQILQLAVSSAKAIIHSIAMAVGTIGIPFALIIMTTALFLILFQSCTIPYLTGMLGSYTAEPSEIHGSATYMTELELALQNEIDGIESDPTWFHIDEFDFSPSKNAMIDSITHNPVELLAYLSAVYHDFQLADVKGRIYQIFHEMYQLDYRVETYEELVGYDDDDDPIYETRYILHVTFTKTEFLDIVMTEIEADPIIKKDFDVYMEMIGSSQAVRNPFTLDWRPYVTCNFGYRINPMDSSSTQFHPGMDISWSGILGTPLYAGVTGSVASVVYGHNIYGNNVTIQDITGKYVVHYSHCNEIYVRPGDLVIAGRDILATVGSTGASTGPHLDIEIKVNGEYQNPFFILDFS